MADFAVNSGGPILAVSDFARSLEFYTGPFGFRVERRYEDPDFAILSRGPVRLSLIEDGAVSDEDRPGVVPTAIRDRLRPQVMLLLWVDDCPSTYEQLETEGVEFASPPVHPPWGGSRCYAIDPDGYLVEIEQLADS